MSMDGVCSYCSKPTNSLAGNPGMWPLYFQDPDDDVGKGSHHHESCVVDKIAKLMKTIDQQGSRIASLEAQLAQQARPVRKIVDKLREVGSESGAFHIDRHMLLDAADALESAERRLAELKACIEKRDWQVGAAVKRGVAAEKRVADLESQLAGQAKPIRYLIQEFTGKWHAFEQWEDAAKVSFPGPGYLRCTVKELIYHPASQTGGESSGD